MTAEEKKNQPERVTQHRLPAPVINGIAGSCGGAAAACVTSPLDVAKVRLQAQRGKPGDKSRLYNGPIGTVRTIFKAEGFRGITAGLQTALLALSPNWAIYFVSYNEFKPFYARIIGKPEGPATHLLAACSAGWIADLFCQPLWLVRTRLMTQGRSSFHEANLHPIPGSIPIMEPRYKGTFHALSRIAKEEGFRALYGGLSAQLLWNSLTLSIQFPVYEHLKKIFAERTGKKTDQLSSVQYIASSGLAKMIASTCTYPLEVVRTRRQIERGSNVRIPKIIAEIYQSEGGLSAFYKGLTTNLLRVVPGAAVTFTTYELISRHLKKWSER